MEDAPTLQCERPSKLSFDRRFVDHRPDLRDSFVAELIEDVLRENDPPAVHWETEKEALGPAVEAEPARDMGRIADQEFDVELEVRDLFEIALEHRAITGETERPAVVTRVVGNETMQIRPVLPVQACDVAPVEVGESDFGHGATLTQRRAERMALGCANPLMSQGAPSQRASNVPAGDGG